MIRLAIIPRARSHLTFCLDKRVSLVGHKCRPFLELRKDLRLTSPGYSSCSEDFRLSYT